MSPSRHGKQLYEKGVINSTNVVTFSKFRNSLPDQNLPEEIRPSTISTNYSDTYHSRILHKVHLPIEPLPLYLSNRWSGLQFHGTLPCI